MKALRLITAFLFAPLGAFAVVELITIADILGRPFENKWNGLFEASIGLLAVTYWFYFWGLAIIVPTIFVLYKKQKLNVVSTSITGTLFGGAVGLLLMLGDSRFGLLPIVGLAMGMVSGWLLWMLMPKRAD